MLAGLISSRAEDIPDRTISHSRPSHKLTPVQSTRCSPFPGALAIGDLVKSTLGPKISQSTSAGDFNATNDGATILRSIQLHDAAVKILVNIWKVQDNEVGDGTTSTVEKGYQIANAEALEALEKAAVNHASDPVQSCQDFPNIARTMPSSKVLSHDEGYPVNLAVCAVTISPQGIQALGFHKKFAELERAEQGKVKAKIEAIAAHGMIQLLLQPLTHPPLP
ncbi:hypothetical protein SCLCIDRAFT_34105 [Scleroderma citrinum Foug A]|uniref:Uncharacterized protein n=1 Tax=Scleroderma citrinum Foug A TaxID=1036808 RepID=A0A0C3D2P3_9AGAM|nr:hypothetical protein SCLCIDRAFT_34105 [Scleroderma citrinum Foug A]